MSTMKTLLVSSDKHPMNQNILQDLVEPREKYDVPNHLLDTKIYSKLSQNSTTKVQPGVVHFNGYKLHKLQKTSIKICNASPERQNVHIIPPATKYFSIQYTKPNRFVPGFAIEVTVTFLPDEWRYYYDCIRIHCQGEDNILVPLHAFPVMDTSKFPRKLIFSSSSLTLGERSVKMLPLSSECPVDFEFQITILQSHPSFKIEPLSGIVPGEGKTNIMVTFTPTEYVTAHMKMQLVISQFNTKPFLCEVSASCTPSTTVQLNRSVKHLDELYQQTKLLDPRSIMPVQIARKRQKSVKNVSPRIPAMKEFEFDGLQFPASLNTQHAVNSVLIQQKGKLNAKDLRQAVIAKSSSLYNAALSTDSLMSVENTRQMKEAAFERIVRQDVVEERANQLRWQVHLGQSPMSDGDKAAILHKREIVNDHYKYVKRKDPRDYEELVRSTSTKVFGRLVRNANEHTGVQPRFDLYKNNPWSIRHRALIRFQQAARTILIRCRAQKKVVMLRKLIANFDKDSTHTFRGSIPNEPASPFQIQGRADKNSADNLLVNFTPDTVKPYLFPVYVSPDTKDDTAPDALGVVPVEPTEVALKRHIPFHDLVVPRYYQLAGYEYQDVSDALKSYVAPGLARPLRSGAEDELIKVTLPPHLIQTTADTDVTMLPEVTKPSADGDNTARLNEDAPDITDADRMETARSSGLIPPNSLFKNPPYHKLHIFNQAPGVTRHYLPIPQSEIDQNYHLCPIPRHTMLPGANKFLDREDVVKGIMSWKKFSSHGLGALSNTPALTDVWLPRWSDAFSKAMIPTTTPEILQQFPEGDEMNLLDNKESLSASFPIMTPQMVRAQFYTEKELRKEWEKSLLDDEAASTIHISNDTIDPTSSREDRRRDLDNAVLTKYDKLGEQMKEQLKRLELDSDS